MRKILMTLMLTGTAYAQLPDGLDLSGLSLQSITGSSECSGLLQTLDSNKKLFSFSGTPADRGCLRGTVGLQDWQRNLWDSGFDLGISSYPLLEKMELWQKLGGTQGLLYLYEWFPENNALTVAWIRLNDMKSQLTHTLFHPDVGLPLSVVPDGLTSENLLYFAGQCFDGSAVLKDLLGNRSATLLHHGCQNIRTTVEGMKARLKGVPGFALVDQAEGKNEYIWLAEHQSQKGHYVYLNLRPDAQDPSFLRISWLDFKLPY